MKPMTILFSLLFAMPALLWADDTQRVQSPTEDVMTADYLGEQEMKHRCLTMLGRFMRQLRLLQSP